LRETSPGVYRLDHDHGHHDDRAIALALAAVHLAERGPVRPMRIGIPRGRLPSAGEMAAAGALAQGVQ
jgi:hypothetical protein